MGQQRPTVGRIVHYVSYGTPAGEYTRECRAAIVTEVGANEDVGLCVLNPTGQFFRSLAAGGCAHVEAPVDGNPDAYHGGTWHWPERA